MSEPSTYCIRIRGRLNAKWADWFERMTITVDAGGDSTLAGPVVDQTALYGLLDKIRDLGMELISVNQVQSVDDRSGENEEWRDGYDDCGKGSRATARGPAL